MTPTDPDRPRLHFTAQEGWINDPLGLTFHGGRYHLFFQYVPGQVEWGPNQRWGHATSPDLLEWTEAAPALEPGDGDDGCWSGSIVVDDDGGAHLFYTTVTLSDLQIGRARVAYPADASWATWTKGDVVAEVPGDLDVAVYRDPYVFRDGETWRMLVGAGLADGTPTAYVHSSPDLAHWTFDGELARRSPEERDPVWTGRVWECPQLFPLDGRHVLTISVWQPFIPHYEAYAIGTYADGRFEAETWGRLSYGPSYYAGSAYADADGRRGLVYWLRRVDDEGGRWASATSLPHVLALRGDRLVAAPHPALAERRGEGRRLDHAVATARGVAATTCDVVWTVDGSGRAGLVLETATAPGEYAVEPGVLVDLDVHDGVLTASTVRGEWRMPVEAGDVRVVADGPVIEIFAETGVMAFPVPPAPTPTLTVTVRGSVATVYDLV